MVGWDLVIVTEGNRLRLLRLLRRVYSGRHLGRPGVEYRKMQHLRVGTALPQWVALDGEVVGRTPAAVSVAPAALTVLAEEATSHDHRIAGDGRG